MHPPDHIHGGHHDHDHDHDECGRCQHDVSSETWREYRQYGVQFHYPENWTLTEQDQGDDVSISLQSEGTSFWTLMLMKSRPDPEQVLATVATAMEQDYEDVDIASSIDNLCGLPAYGCDLDFVCYDLVNSAWVRAFQTSEMTVMVLYQGTDQELSQTGDQLRAVTASLQLDEEVEDRMGQDL